MSQPDSVTHSCACGREFNIYLAECVEPRHAKMCPACRRGWYNALPQSKHILYLREVAFTSTLIAAGYKGLAP